MNSDYRVRIMPECDPVDPVCRRLDWILDKVACPVMLLAIGWILGMLTSLIV